MRYSKSDWYEVERAPLTTMPPAQSKIDRLIALTEQQLQAELVDAAFAEANADQELLRRQERGMAYQQWLRDHARGSAVTLAEALGESLTGKRDEV